MCICIVGLGKIGLPLAVQSASSGRDVIGVDISRDVVDSVNSGISPFSGELDLENKLLLNCICIYIKSLFHICDIKAKNLE